MHCCERNKRVLWYALNNGTVAVTDEYGLKTGEYAVQYSEPVKVRMNIAPATGRSSLMAFGLQTPYSHLAITEDINCPMKEDSVVWYGIDPYDNGASVPANYRVIGVAKGLDTIMYALKAVDTE